MNNSFKKHDSDLFNGMLHHSIKMAFIYLDTFAPKDASEIVKNYINDFVFDKNKTSSIIVENFLERYTDSPTKYIGENYFIGFARLLWSEFSQGKELQIDSGTKAFIILFSMAYLAKSEIQQNTNMRKYKLKS